jgi:hypothetical protein
MSSIIKFVIYREVVTLNQINSTACVFLISTTHTILPYTFQFATPSMNETRIFDYHNITIVSENVYRSFVYIQRLILLFTFITCFLLIHVVWKCSPEKIGNYKWLVYINNTF